MDIFAASSIGMTNAYKNKKRVTKRKKIEKNKLYVLAEIKYTIDGILGNNKVVITLCNTKKLVEIAQEYYKERKLKCIHKWKEMDINNLTPKDAIKILTTRQYANIKEIDEDVIGEKIIKNKIVKLISVNDFVFSKRGEQIK